MERPLSIRPPWPVSFLLALSIVALAVPLLAFLGMEAWRLASAERARLFGEVRIGAERIAADIDQTLNGYIAILETLATTPALAEGDYATVYRQAQAALNSRGLYAFLRDLDGQQLLNTRLPYGAVLPKTQGFDVDVAHMTRPHVSDVVIGSVANRPVMAASVPVLRNGKMRYVLSLSLEPALMKELLDRQQLPAEWRATVTDSKGVMIARSRLHDENVGKKMTALKGGQRGRYCERRPRRPHREVGNGPLARRGVERLCLGTLRVRGRRRPQCTSQLRLDRCSIYVCRHCRCRRRRPRHFGAAQPRGKSRQGAG
jgi:hypothetical protein